MTLQTAYDRLVEAGFNPWTDDYFWFLDDGETGQEIDPQTLNDELTTAWEIIKQCDPYLEQNTTAR